MRLLWPWQSTVARRVFLSFLAATAIPLLMVTGATYLLVSDALREQSRNEAHQLAKSMSMSLFERLKFVHDEIRVIGASLRQAEIGSELVAGLHLSERVHGLFVLQQDGSTGWSSASLAEDLAQLGGMLGGTDPDKPLLLQPDAPSASLLLIAERPPGRPWRVGTQIDTEFLWDGAEVAGRAERICILGDRDQVLYCNHVAPEGWLEGSRQMLHGRAPPRLLEHESGTRLLTAVWPLFLKPHYQIERWTVVVGMPRQAGLETFQRLFGLIATIALATAFLSGAQLVRRNLVPLSALGHATRELMRGHFGHRVHIRSNDEFQQLGTAFNDMAERLGEQVHELHALSEVNAALPRSRSVREAITTTTQALAGLIGQGRCALLCRESWPDAPRTWFAPFGAQVTLPVDDVGGSFDDLPAEGLAAELRAAFPYLRHLDAAPDDRVESYRFLQTGNGEALALTRGISATQHERLLRVLSMLAVTLDNLMQEQRLQYQVAHDWLTGLPSRQEMRRRFDQWSPLVLQQGGTISMLLLDLDRFRQINDSQGHFLADRLLGDVARRLRDALSPEIQFSRFAGDSFVLMFPSENASHGLAELTRQAAGISEELDRPFETGLREVRLTASMGAAVFPDHGGSFEAMLQCLDASMRAAKQQRRGELLLFSSGMRDALIGRMDLEQALKGAVANRELLLHYQPVVDMATAQVVSAEALLRWQRPGVGLAMPGEFIDVAEQSGLIVPLGRWAMAEACRQLRCWQDAGLGIRSIAVNVSGVQLLGADFVDCVDQVLEESGIPPHALTLEITESALIGDIDLAIDHLRRLRALGVGVSIDDFGTGFASLTYLKMLPISAFKIDRMFVEDLPDSLRDRAIVAALTGLARDAGVSLVAEGIETVGQMACLRELGVPLAQGYLIDRPLAAEVLEMRLRREQITAGAASAPQWSGPG